MVEKVSLQPETVQTQAKDLNDMGEDVRDADAQWKGATRGNANFFEQMLEKDLKRSAQAFRQSRERLHEAVQEYAQRLSTTVDIFTKTEESQMDAINDAQAKVAAAPSADSTGRWVSPLRTAGRCPPVRRLPSRGGAVMVRFGRRGRLPGMVSALTSCLLCAGLCAGLCARTAAADGTVDWRIEDMGVRDAWDAGLTGKGVKVAVIDDQVVRDYPALADADVTYRLALSHGDSCHDVYDKNRVMSKRDMTLGTADGFNMTHGTHMVALIVGNGKGYDGGAGIQGIAPDASVIAYPYNFAITGSVSTGSYPVSPTRWIRARASSTCRSWTRRTGTITGRPCMRCAMA